MNKRPSCHIHASSRGFTLVEIVITIIILGSVSLILIPFFSAIIHSPDPMLRQRAISLGQAMMDEIMAKKWDHNSPMGGGPIITGESPAPAGTTCEPCDGNRLYCFYICAGLAAPGSASTTLGPEGETRAGFNDVDDYHGSINENETFQDQNGETFTMPGYTRRVQVCYIPSTTPIIDYNGCVEHAVPDPTDTKLVVVTVDSPRGETFHFVSAVCNL